MSTTSSITRYNRSTVNLAFILTLLGLMHRFHLCFCDNLLFDDIQTKIKDALTIIAQWTKYKFLYSVMRHLTKACSWGFEKPNSRPTKTLLINVLVAFSIKYPLALYLYSLPNKFSQHVICNCVGHLETVPSVSSLQHQKMTQSGNFSLRSQPCGCSNALVVPVVNEYRHGYSLLHKQCMQGEHRYFWFACFR